MVSQAIERIHFVAPRPAQLTGIRVIASFGLRGCMDLVYSARRENYVILFLYLAL
jgi:hypothetical protein